MPNKENIGCAVIVTNFQGQVLLGKRKNGYKSGYYGLPGGRIDGNELLADCAIRELVEETGLAANKITYLGVVKEWQRSHHFIHFIYLCSHWSGEVEICEPDKCETWQWFNLDHLPDKILPGHVQAIDLWINREVKNLRDV